MDNWIKIRGAREHNLKNIDVDIPRGKFVVITGLSGSGKSSLAFDTIYVEGQRRYVESLSAYARMFLGRLDKPDVDSIEGLSPSISIDQKTTSHNPRSTVGTVTEIYDYLRLLFARAGTPYCPKCGKPIEATGIDSIVDQIMHVAQGKRILVLAPLAQGKKGEFKKLFEDLAAKGFVRVRVDGTIFSLDEEIKLAKTKKHDIAVVVDRIALRDESRSRLADSLETALELADDIVEIAIGEADETCQYIYQSRIFSRKLACPQCNISISEISPRLFSFNNPIGACKECSGLGTLHYFSPDLIVPQPEKSLNEGAVQAIGWRSDEKTSWGRCFYVALAAKYDFSLDTPWKDLPEKIKRIILYGNGRESLSIDTTNTKYNRGSAHRTHFEGVIRSLERRYNESASEEMKATYEQYMSVSECPSCHGARLCPEALAVKLNDVNIHQLTLLPINEALDFLLHLKLTGRAEIIAERIVRELRMRLEFLLNVGLDYLSLGRSASTLSGGEAQRIRLATQIGAGLMGVLYVLDEPSIGLHQRDNGKLLSTLEHLRDLGNTVIVVEHDEETMWRADYIIDMGPGAGAYGGQVVGKGTANELINQPDSLTGRYLSGREKIPVPAERRPGNGFFLHIAGAQENNLRNIDVDIPLGTFTCVTGVSGSGKSSLINGTLRPYLETLLQGSVRKTGKCQYISGIEYIDKIIAIDQSPIGRTPRSNPATYTGVFDLIRALFASTVEAKAKGYLPGRFSFNVKGGRCEACSGDGVNKIEMHFLPDMYVPCEVCKGKRYNRETLNVRYKGKTIADVLDLTISEAAKLFKDMPRIADKLQTLLDVGLGYLHLGQPSTQLSGGEAQRIKLAGELSKRSTGKTIYILDEPTTGLHMADVKRLIDILQTLTRAGNTVLVIEHNLDMIKTADYIIDLGPGGGKHGGTVVATGTPEEVATNAKSYTGQYLKKLLSEAQTESGATD